MATVSETVYTRNTTHAGLSALISNRCSPERYQNGETMPTVRYLFVSTPPNLYSDHDAAPPDRWTWRVQMEGYAETATERASLGDEMWKAWEGYSLKPDLGWARVDNRIDDYDTGLNLYKHIVEVVLDHKI
jgi:hypothetical protein